MPLLLSQTYETYDEEARDAGGTDDSGFDWEDVPHTVSEAARLLKGRDPSQSPITDPAHCWFSESDTCMWSGEEKITSIHFSHANSPHALRYWCAAIREAGFTIHGD